MGDYASIHEWHCSLSNLYSYNVWMSKHHIMVRGVNAMTSNDTIQHCPAKVVLLFTMSSHHIKVSCVNHLCCWINQDSHHHIKLGSINNFLCLWDNMAIMAKLQLNISGVKSGVGIRDDNKSEYGTSPKWRFFWSTFLFCELVSTWSTWLAWCVLQSIYYNT